MVDVYTWCVVPLHKSATLALSVKNMHDGWIASRNCDSGHRAQFIKAWLLYLKDLGYMQVIAVRCCMYHFFNVSWAWVYTS